MSLIVPLYKNSDAEVIENYRGILLGSCVIFTRLLASRLGKFWRVFQRHRKVSEIKRVHIIISYQLYIKGVDEILKRESCSYLTTLQGE